MSAGRGSIHSETSTVTQLEEHRKAHGHQVRVNLLARDNLMAPRCQKVRA